MLNKRQTSNFFNFEQMNNIFNKVKNLTLLSQERVNINIQSINYIIDNNIDGDVVEIGVYKGGSILSLMLQLEYRNHKNRLYWNLFL